MSLVQGYSLPLHAHRVPSPSVLAPQEMDLGADELEDFGAVATGAAEVGAFYACWLNFTTRKEFAWVDKYNPSAAPDRKTRRLMEEENTKVRTLSTGLGYSDLRLMRIGPREINQLTPPFRHKNPKPLTRPYRGQRVRLESLGVVLRSGAISVKPESSESRHKQIHNTPPQNKSTV